MNIKHILKLFTKIFMIKKSLERTNIHYFINNITVYTDDFNKLTCSERMMIHSMMNLVNY